MSFYKTALELTWKLQMSELSHPSLNAAPVRSGEACLSLSRQMRWKRWERSNRLELLKFLQIDWTVSFSVAKGRRSEHQRV